MPNSCYIFQIVAAQKVKSDRMTYSGGSYHGKIVQNCVNLYNMQTISKIVSSIKLWALVHYLYLFVIIDCPLFQRFQAIVADPWLAFFTSFIRLIFPQLMKLPVPSYMRKRAAVVTFTKPCDISCFLMFLFIWCSVVL